MDIRITPAFLKGKIQVPPSKSVSHRAMICAALADGTSRIENLLRCADTEATAEALTALGAEIKADGTASVKGIGRPAGQAIIDCRESGSTLRFLLPVAAALGTNAVFKGSANLPNRPITPYFSEFEKHGVSFLKKEMPYEVKGRLIGGEFQIAGNISSQFITGLLLALPLVREDSVVRVLPPFESKPYVDLTIDVMKKFGVLVEENEDGYRIKGRQKYRPASFAVEADLSQAAFFLTANVLGGNIDVLGIDPNSVQGDREILNITRRCAKTRAAFDYDASQTPDLVPILTVLACFMEGTSHITGCGRLRIKECDRLAVISDELNRLGAKIKVGEESLTIQGVRELNGGICGCHTDHRIPMSLAVASQRCAAPLTLCGAECVSKSYPNFFEDFKSLGGKADVI